MKSWKGFGCMSLLQSHIKLSITFMTNHDGVGECFSEAKDSSWGKERFRPSFDAIGFRELKWTQHDYGAVVGLRETPQDAF